MNSWITDFAGQHGCGTIRFVDLTPLSPHQTMGYAKAVFLCLPLSRPYIRHMMKALPVDDDDEFLRKEHDVERTADQLADALIQKGYASYSLSERNHLAHQHIDPITKQGISPLPVKTIGRLAGFGFIGRNNLLINETYGCAFCMSAVLTDAPITVQQAPHVQPACGSCTVCRDICPYGALRGVDWQPDGTREHLLQVGKCRCPLKCMLFCPWTQTYAGFQSCV